jgi:hypothetical protein
MRPSEQGNEGCWGWPDQRVSSPPSRPKRFETAPRGFGYELSLCRLPTAHEAASAATFSDAPSECSSTLIATPLTAQRGPGFGCVLLAQDCTFVTPKYCGVLGHLFRRSSTSRAIGRVGRKEEVCCTAIGHQRWRCKLGWMCERIHYDPQPIDVVILGASALSAAAIEKQLAEHGLGKAAWRR